MNAHLETSQVFAAMLLMNIPALALVGWPGSGRIAQMEALNRKFIASNIFLLKDVAKWVYEIR